jgi:tRNA G18 (ribose-2'-O)-methylase SpoU
MNRDSEVVDTDDPRLDAYRNVSDAELLRSQGLFVAEGRLVMRRVVDDARYRLVSVVVNHAAHRDLADVLARVPATVPLLLADGAALEKVTGYHVHRGCLALVERPRLPSIEEVIARDGIVLVLEGVTNADNVGGVFRNAAAFGAAGVVLSPTCCDPLYRKAVRTSMGAVLQVTYARAESWPYALTEMKAAGRRIVALTPRASQSIGECARLSRGQSIALVAGTEGDGLSSEVEAIADARVSIPMADGVDSLNVAVALGVSLYALTSVQKPNRAPSSIRRGGAADVA